ncbi:MAG: DUF2079 domain-containing protein [Candidatus Freyarchaeota archaeon]|nr:DUF2079 domain-containing protein [Candidatus Jordarchaeia archaeon]MBS7270446.1 DUF2079 domain-containing protein [Candidatus Jordarchaeia archaeon]MBS7278327.1 DUF2079 domain-containing protein [Candidatus Jordarchaeia archaeon]
MRGFLEFAEKRATGILVVTLIVYTLVFSYFTVLKYYTFDTFAGDLGIFEQSLWSTLQYGFFLYNTPELGAHFKTHFDPILLLLLPAYSVYPSPLTLLVLQSFFISLGAVPIFYFAADTFRSRNVALLFVTLYLLYPPLQGVNWYDFHPECLVPFFLGAAFYLFRKRRYFSFFLLIVLGMMCKETVTLIVFFMGLYGLWINRRKILAYSVLAPKELVRDGGIVFSILTLGMSALWYLLASKIIESYSVTGQAYYFFWGYLGVGLLGIIRNIILNPFYALQLAFTPFQAKTFYLLVLFAPLAFLSFMNPPSLLIATPWLTASMLSLIPNYYLPVGTQYPALIIPFIFASAIYGAKNIESIIKTLTQKITKNRFTKSVLLNNRRRLLLKTITLPKNSLKITFIMLLIVGLSCGVAWTPLRLAKEITPHDRILESVVRLIPPYFLVSTQNDIFPHLSHNLNAYPVYYPEIEFEYILVDTTTVWYYVEPLNYGNWPNPPKSFSSVVPKLLESKEYGLIVAIDGIMLLKRGYNGTPLLNITFFQYR